MVILVTRRGDVNTATALARVLEGHPDVRVIMERRTRPLARPAVADRRRLPEMREVEQRKIGNRRTFTRLFTFDGLLT